MTTHQTMLQKIGTVAREPLEITKAVVSKTDGLEKAAKFICSVIDGVGKVLERCGSAAFIAATLVFRGRLKIVADVISGLNLIGRVYEWICPAEGQSVPFWLVKQKTPLEKFVLATKIVSRGFLTAAHAIDFMKLLNTFGLINLGKVASAAVGTIPIINLVKDSIMIVSAGFSLASGVATEVKAMPELKKANRKCKMWKQTGEALQKPKKSTPSVRLTKKSSKKAAKQAAKKEHAKEAFINSLAKKCKVKADFYDAAIKKQEAVLDKTGSSDKAKADATAKIEAFSGKKDKWSAYVEESDDAKLAPVLEGGIEGYAHRKLEGAIGKQQADVDKKQALYDAVQTRIDNGEPGVDASSLDAPRAALEMSQIMLNRLRAAEGNGNDGMVKFANHKYEVFNATSTNAFRKVMKGWIGIVYDVAKIAIIVIGTVGTLLALVCPIVFGSFAWMVGLAALSIFVAGLGLAKFIYEARIGNEKAQIPIFI